MRAVVNVNGRISTEADAVISIFDHGFLFGEGVYETIRTYNGRPFLFGRHMARLRRSAERLMLDVPFSDADLLARVGETAASLQGPGERYIRMLLTRGIGDLTYDPKACPTPSMVIVVRPFEPVPARTVERGVKIAIVPIMRNHPDSVSPLIKSNNLLNNAIAMQQALSAGGAEGLMRNYRGELAECSQANFFVVRHGRAETPPLSAGVLAGLTRELLFELGPSAGVPVVETPLTEADLETADEAFFTSTTKELLPVVQIDERQVGGGRPGPATLRLLEAYRRFAEESTRPSS